MILQDTTSVIYFYALVFNKKDNKIVETCTCNVSSIELIKCDV